MAVFDNKKLFNKDKTSESAKSIEWETPPEIFNPLNDEFHFTLDVCASKSNKKCDRYFSKTEDGLFQSWSGEVCWMNPPFGRPVQLWIRKALEESLGGATVVCLIPAKTNTNWWHELVIGRAEVRFVRGRIKFIRYGKQTTQALPWPMAILIYGRPHDRT
jgi:site-specific DNA-methyltransferase (adenine-specific)